MLRLLGPIALLVANLPCPAQVQYDAGTPGNPPIAPSPTTQGWTEEITGSCSVVDFSPDPDWSFNAWQVKDQGAGRVRYSQSFDPGPSDYAVEFVLRPVAGPISIEIDAGDAAADNLFQFSLLIVGADIYIVELGSSTSVVCPSAMAEYHSYHFASGPNRGFVDVRFDGVFIGQLPRTDAGAAVAGDGLRWGTLEGSAGRARFQRATMSVVQPGPLGENYCGPAVPNSSGAAAGLAATGSPFAWSNDVRLEASDLAPNQFGYFLVSAAQNFVVGPGGSQGNLCLGGSLGRFAAAIASSGPNGVIALDIDLANLPTTPAASVLSGEAWNFQLWFRDVNPAPTSNFTDGLAIQF